MPYARIAHDTIAMTPARAMAAAIENVTSKVGGWSLNARTTLALALPGGLAQKLEPGRHSDAWMVAIYMREGG